MTDFNPQSATPGSAVNFRTWDSEGKSPADIELEIERTRGRMSEDIDAIGEKLNPEIIKQRARDVLYDAQEVVVRKVQDMASGVGRRSKDAGAGLFRLVQEHPVPAALIGVGVTWLVAEARKSSAERNERYDREGIGRYPYPTQQLDEVGSGSFPTGRSRARAWAGRAEQKFGELSQRAGHQAERARNSARRMFDESPLMAAAGVAVLGGLIGAALPRTKQENRLMGSKRDDFLETAGDMAHRAKQTFSDRLSETEGRVHGTGAEMGGRGEGPRPGGSKRGR